MTTIDYRINSDKTAAVAGEFHWLDAKQHPPPEGVKLLAINQTQGIAVLTIWNQHFGWTHWAPLPKFNN